MKKILEENPQKYIRLIQIYHCKFKKDSKGNGIVAASSFVQLVRWKIKLKK
jgi:hypothetical protein